MANYQTNFVEMLSLNALAQRQRGITTLSLLSGHPAGIGDHSTSDLYNNADEALTAIADADGKLSAIKSIFDVDISFDQFHISKPLTR